MTNHLMRILGLSREKLHVFDMVDEMKRKRVC